MIRSAGVSDRYWRYPEGSKMPGREQVWWAMAHALEDLVREQSLLRESAAWQEELLEDLFRT